MSRLHKGKKIFSYHRAGMLSIIIWHAASGQAAKAANGSSNTKSTDEVHLERADSVLSLLISNPFLVSLGNHSHARKQRFVNGNLPDVFRQRAVMQVT
jgi:hypothetical protein